MIRRFSDVLGVTAVALAGEGAFNGFVGIDSKLHIDPHLLSASAAPELAKSYERLTSYFTQVIQLIDLMERPNGRLFRELVQRLIFKEIRDIWLGYGREGNSGKGIGEELAIQLAYSAIDIVKAGIREPAVFELVGLLEDGIGADRISDMTARIILPDLAAFSVRVAKNLGIVTRSYLVYGKQYDLPYDKQKRRRIYLVPQDILNPLPIANDYSGIEDVIAYNDQLRRSFNELIGRNWRTFVRQMKKGDLRGWFMQHPALFQKFVISYKEQKGRPYDFKKDPLGVLSWQDQGLKWAADYPFTVDVKPIEPEEIADVVLRVCKHFGRLIAQEGMSLVLYDDRGNPRQEIIAKNVFYGMADAYCEANDLALMCQLNSDGESVDFSISRGYRAKVQVYVKLTTNSHLVDVYEKAMVRCQDEERGETAVFVVIRTTEQDTQSPRLRQLHGEAKQAGLAAPTLVLADGRYSLGRYKAHLAKMLKENEEKAKSTPKPTNGARRDEWNRFRKKTRKRAKLVKKLKEENPSLSQLQVSIKAQEKLGYKVSLDDVINDYRRMKELGLIDWEWGRSDSIN